MADEEGTGTPKRKKSRRLNYFYLNGLLHKKLHINRASDIITTWCYPEHRRVAYTYSQVRRTYRPAFTTIEVGKMLNRNRVSIELAIMAGNIPRPQHTYGLGNQDKIFKYMWSEDDVLAAHAYFQTVHRGRPRKDGLVTPQKMPTARELRALMRDEEVLYVKRGDTYLPTFRAD